MKFNSRGKIGPIKHSIKVSIYLGIGAGIFGIIMLQSMIRENVAAMIIVLVSSVLSLFGSYLAKKERKSSAFVLLIASLILLCAKLFGYDNPVPPYFMGLACSFASINAFEMLNFKGSTFDGNEELEDIMRKQDTWYKNVNDFISRYTIFTYYGYLFAAFACIALHGVWSFAPEIIKGHSREYWALICSVGLVAISILFTETSRKNV